MNLDNINPENRTTTNMNRLRQQKNQRRNNNFAIRSCSFCRRPGHNINLCNDQRLQDFDSLCINKKIEFEYCQNPISAFEDWIYEYWNDNKTLVKAYAVNKCGALMSDRLYIIIERIMIHFYDDEYLLRENGASLQIENEDFHIESGEEISNNLEFLRDLRTLMMMMRMLTQPDLQTDSERKFAIQSNLDKIESQEKCNCNICYDEINVTNFVKLNCNHEFCKECIKSTLKSCNIFSEPMCALCRAPIKKFTFKNSDVQCELTEMII